MDEEEKREEEEEEEEEDDDNLGETVRWMGEGGMYGKYETRERVGNTARRRSACESWSEEEEEDDDDDDCKFECVDGSPLSESISS